MEVFKLFYVAISFCAVSCTCDSLLPRGLSFQDISDLSCMAGKFESYYDLATFPGCSEQLLKWVRVPLDGVGSCQLAEASDREYICGGGTSPRLMVWKRRKDSGAAHGESVGGPRSVAVVWKHQDSESLFFDEMWEAMGQYGLSRTIMVIPGLPYIFRVLAWGLGEIIQSARLYFGFAWHPHPYPVNLTEVDTTNNKIRAGVRAALAACDVPVERASEELVFSGFSLGGTVAQWASAEAAAPAVVFASPGVGGTAPMRLRNTPSFPFPAPAPRELPDVLNFYLEEDETPSLDCQSGRTCQVPASAFNASEMEVEEEEWEEAELQHWGLIYNTHQVLTPSVIRASLESCWDAVAWNAEYGTCEHAVSTRVWGEESELTPPVLIG